MLDQPTQFIRRDEPTAQAKDDLAYGEFVRSKRFPS